MGNKSMFNSKRLMVAVFFGFVMGLSCIFGAMLIFGMTFNTPELINVIINRMLIGFVIGISILKMRWYSHGLLIGFVVGLPFLLYDYITGKEMMIVISVAILNPIYGLMIEFFTSKVFKLER